MAEGSLQEGPERPLCEAVDTKPGLQWRPQDVENARDGRDPPEESSGREWNHPQEREGFVVTELEG